MSPGERSGSGCNAVMQTVAEELFPKASLEELFEIGKIVKTHGLKGRVKVNACLVDPRKVLERADEIFLERAGVRKGPLKVARWDAGGGGVFLQIAGIDAPEAAEPLVGWDILISTANLPLPDEGEFYWRDLIGMKIMTEDGATLGKLTAIFPAGGADVYVCTSERGELLLPAIGDVVLAIDKAAGVMTVRILEGMDRP